MKKSTGPGRWAIVLSGGEGKRMSPFIRRWLGQPRPKQYCAFTGGRTLLEHTLDRATDSVTAERVLTVINRDHSRFLETPRRLEIPGRIIAEPCPRDTAPGVFLPLIHVTARDPEALVAIMPSDHFIHPRKRFSRLLDEAFRLAETLPGWMVLLAARPDDAEHEYGWISPGAKLYGGDSMLVDGFREKPGPSESDSLYRKGGLWNTMIVVARASALWGIAREVEPEMSGIFGALKGWIGRREEAEAVEYAYQEMPSINFSRHIMGRAADCSVVLPMNGIRWSDWGRPRRVQETLRRIGKASLFPEELVEDPTLGSALAAGARSLRSNCWAS